MRLNDPRSKILLGLCVFISCRLASADEPDAPIKAGINRTVSERMALIKAGLVSTPGRSQIGDVHPSAVAVSCFHRLELTFRLAADYTNPYDPDDIRVDAVITFPDGTTTVTVPAFYFEPFRPERGVAQMMLWVRDFTHQLTDGYRPIIYGSNYRLQAGKQMDYAQAGAAAPQDRPQVLQE